MPTKFFNAKVTAHEGETAIIEAVYRENAADLQFELIKSSYKINKHEEDEIKEFVLSHGLTDFLVWILGPILIIYGDIRKTLQLNRCWDEEEYHLVLGIYSGIENMDEVTVLENKLFQILDENQQLAAFEDVVVAQR